MKTILRTSGVLLLVFAVALAQAQSKSYRMYDAFSNKEGVTNFSFSKNMIDAIDLDLGENGDEKQVKGDLHEIRFMSYNPERGQWSGADFMKKALSYLPKPAYTKYEGEDLDPELEIWLLGRKNKFKECHVFLHNSNEQGNKVVVSFYGDFTVNDLNGLTKAGKSF